jgi:hypothetical protein
MKKYVGKSRKENLDWLLNVWLKDGPPVCFLQGFSGVGKTDLARDFREFAERQQASQARCQALSLAGKVPCLTPAKGHVIVPTIVATAQTRPHRHGPSRSVLGGRKRSLALRASGPGCSRIQS